MSSSAFWRQQTFHSATGGSETHNPKSRHSNAASAVLRRALLRRPTISFKDARFWQNGKKLELAGYHDMAELAELTPKAMGKFPNGMKFEILTVAAEENRVLIESESNATLANGTHYNNQYVFAFYLDEDGKILEFREYWDPLYAYETMFEGKTTL